MQTHHIVGLNKQDVKHKNEHISDVNKKERMEYGLLINRRDKTLATKNFALSLCLSHKPTN
jgi:hypothetical protein